MVDLGMLRAQLEAMLESTDPSITPRDRAKALEQYTGLFGDEIREQQARAREAVRLGDPAAVAAELDGFLTAVAMMLMGDEVERTRFPSFWGLLERLSLERAAWLAEQRRLRPDPAEPGVEAAVAAFVADVAAGPVEPVAEADPEPKPDVEAEPVEGRRAVPDALVRAAGAGWERVDD